MSGLVVNYRPMILNLHLQIAPIPVSDRLICHDAIAVGKQESEQVSGQYIYGYYHRGAEKAPDNRWTPTLVPRDLGILSRLRKKWGYWASQIWRIIRVA